MKLKEWGVKKSDVQLKVSPSPVSARAPLVLHESSGSAVGTFVAQILQAADGEDGLLSMDGDHSTYAAPTLNVSSSVSTPSGQTQISLDTSVADRTVHDRVFRQMLQLNGSHIPVEALAPSSESTNEWILENTVLEGSLRCINCDPSPNGPALSCITWFSETNQHCLFYRVC